MDGSNPSYSLLMVVAHWSIIPALLRFAAMPFLWNDKLAETRLREVQADTPARH